MRAETINCESTWLGLSCNFSFNIVCYACIFLSMPTADLSWSGLWSHVVRGYILFFHQFMMVFNKNLGSPNIYV